MVSLPVWLMLIFGAIAVFFCRFYLGIADLNNYVYVVGAAGAVGYGLGIWIRSRRNP